LIIFAAAALPLFLYGDDAGSYAYTSAKAGLIVRAEPSRSGRMLTILRRNTRVEIIGKSENTDTIDSVKSDWYRIKTQGTEGWAFGAYLLKYGEIRKAYMNNCFGGTLFQDRTLSREISGIPYRALLEVVSSEGPVPDKDGTDRAAVRISYNGGEGWVSDSELSFIEIPDYLPGFDPKDQPKFNQAAERYFGGIYSGFGSTKEEIMKRIGKPSKVIETPEPNRHDPSVTNQNIVLQYPGLEIHLLRAGSKSFVTAVVFVDLRYVKSDPYLNAPERKVFESFGIPHLDMETYVSYGVGDSPYQHLVFYRKNGLVWKIAVESFPD
jgi:uncharacterized protein YraI